MWVLYHKSQSYDGTTDDEDCTHFLVLVKAQTHGAIITDHMDTTSFGIKSI